jgi:acetyltransferase-like isoleucine patch superfamily enzyme
MQEMPNCKQTKTPRRRGWCDTMLHLPHPLLRDGLSLGNGLPKWDGAVIRPPFHCDYGYNIYLGTDTFLNFGCIIVDVVAVEIGVGCQIGPAVQILTPDHPP